MTTIQLKNTLSEYTKELPKEILLEILDFVKFICAERTITKKNNFLQNKFLLSTSQTNHLVKEFADYKKIYPRE